MIQTSLLWYVGSFALALGVLIVVHELGHFLVARWVGVKVLRFSVGFGKPLVSRRFGADGTEWVLAAFPLGGYVKMLDEREEPVAEEDLHRAFNRQSVGRRALIVVAGPLANLLLAVFLYWLLFLAGVQELRPILGAPPVGTPAAIAGVADGDQVRTVSGVRVDTMQELRWQLLEHIADRKPINLEVLDRNGDIFDRLIPADAIAGDALDGDFARLIGILPFQPRFQPRIGVVMPESAAQLAGLQSGDLVRSIDGESISTWTQLAEAIRKSPGKPIRLELVRDGALRQLLVTPTGFDEGGRMVGRLGIGLADEPDVRAKLLTVVRLGPIDALKRSVGQTWDTSILSLRMIGRMLIGEQSWKNISGPVTIADYAGQSARMGWDHFLKFLALISISLGVLNLLPVPILDGGHLLYYFLEVVKGGPLSERVMEIGQQIGIGLLALLMALAFFNDINRLVSG